MTNAAEQLAAAILTGHAYYSQGMLEEARKMFAGILIADEDNAYAHAMLGSIFQQIGELEEAVKHYTLAIQLYSEDINSLTNRGEIYLKTGKLKEAAADFEKAFTLDPQGKHPSANRARLLAGMVRNALKMISEEGAGSLDKAKKMLSERLS